MSITRSQIARELMAEGGAPRQGYFLGKLVRKVRDDLIPNELKSPAGAIAAALAVDQFGIPLPGGSKIGGGKVVTGPISRGIQSIFSGRQPDVSQEMSEVSLPIPGQKESVLDKIKKTTTNVLGTKVGDDTLGGKILSGILSPTGLSLGAGLLAGALTKDEDDPLYTGQSVGLNLRDIRKLANITDPRTGSAIGLNFLPETRFRQFTPEQMAETYAATEPVEFTEQRESADTGGRIGFSNGTPDKSKEYDFEDYLKDRKRLDEFFDRQKKFKEFEKDMERFKKPREISAANGGLMNLGGNEMDLRGGGFVPIGVREKADDVPARLSKNEFVFTADAVRAAGGGSVDRGADLMYKTMKQLENKVA